MEANDNGNSKVTLAVILNEIKHLQDNVSDMKDGLKELSGIPQRVATLEKEQEKLRSKSDAWNVLNSVGVFFAGLVAFLTGR